MLVRHLTLVLIATALLAGGCQETATQYVVDERGRLRKIGPALWGPIGKRLSLNVDGTVFTYDLSSVPDRSIYGERSSKIHHLERGQAMRPFSALSRAKTAFSGSISRLKRSLSVTDLPSEAHPGGQAEHMFFPPSKPSSKEFRTIAGRQWLVTTKYEDAEKKIVRSRVFWTVAGSYKITLNVIIDERAPATPEWRQKQLQVLERLAERLTIHP
jgi:hypothetical protein